MTQVPPRRERTLAKIVSDPEGNAKLVRNLGEIHRSGTEQELLDRRDAAAAKMKAARSSMETEMSNVQAAHGFRSDEWGIMHVLWHLGARAGGHMEPARDIVLRGMRELQPAKTRDDVLKLAIDNMLTDMAESIEFAESLTHEQLALTAKRGNRDMYVIGIIESTAEHMVDHLDQIRAIKRRIDVPVLTDTPNIAAT